MIKNLRVIVWPPTLCFRLLNSEIGNDPAWVCLLFENLTVGFRLLNSEIGNDHKQGETWFLYAKYVFVSLTRR